MTDSQSSFSEVPALLDERRRYESWLAALDARRESTPKHVFERVQADYRTRLQRVAEELASHRQAIEEERANLESRRALLQAEEGLRRDERAELELRAHVGELTGSDADSAFGGVDEAIGHLVSEREGLETRIAELGALLSDGDEVAEPEPEPSEPSGAPSESAEAPVEAQAASEATEVVAAEPEPTPAQQESAAEEVAAPASDVAVAVTQSVEPLPPAAAPSAAAPKSDAPAAPAASGNPGSGSAAPSDAPRPRGARGSFDELAFLSSVVGKNDGGSQGAKREAAPAVAPKHDTPLIERRSSEPLLKAAVGIVQEENGGESLLAGVENAKLATGEHPLAANVAANTPIVLRPSTTLEQAKTLKCNECGGLNYPTEWYCERCGAELAAL